jgi:hypothetical protein
MDAMSFEVRLERFQRWIPAIGARQISLPWDWVPHHILTVPAAEHLVGCLVEL